MDWLPVFTRTEAVQVILDSWAYLQSNNRMTLFAFVVLENHLHFIASSDQLAKELGDFKSYTARRLIDLLKGAHAKTLLKQLAFGKQAHKNDRQYQLWQEGSKPKQITSDEMMLQKIEYIHSNPVKRGYVDDPVHWRYSSARNYAGMPGVLEVTREW
uniref:REP-associated tyrosine transposase n=1 Tax=Aeoliella mucimassa TaxID=2527972 RepID=UPI0018D41397|nr:transposase [Aeoliella mucimassa]